MRRVRMTKQIKHRRFMRDERYRKRGSSYEAGSRFKFAVTDSGAVASNFAFKKDAENYKNMMKRMEKRNKQKVLILNILSYKHTNHYVNWNKLNDLSKAMSKKLLISAINNNRDITMKEIKETRYGFIIIFSEMTTNTYVLGKADNIIKDVSRYLCVSKKIK